MHSSSGNKLQITGIQFVQPQGFDNATKVELTFESASAGAHSKSKHANTTDTAKHAGDIVTWDDVVPVDVSGNILKVVAKASKTLLPDKVLGEGQVDVSRSGGGQQRVELINPKTGGPGGIVSFTVSGGGYGTGTGTTGGVIGGAGGQSGYNNGQGAIGQQGYNNGQGATGQQGYNTSGNQGYGQGGVGGAQTGYGDQGQAGYGNQGQQGSGITGGGAGYNQTAGGGGGQAGYGSGAVVQPGYGQTGGGGQQLASQGPGQLGAGATGAGTAGAGPQEHFERKEHNVHDHDENESYETRSRR